MDEPHGLVLKSNEVYRGRILSVHVDRVRMPNGREVTLDVVRHSQSVVLIPMPAAFEIILVRQYRYAIDRWVWELPAGSVDPGESPEAAARRECHEEVGLVPARLDLLGSFYPTPGYCDEIMMFYRLEGLSVPPNLAHQDEDEDITARTFALEEVRRLVTAGEIVDLKTALGLSLIDRGR